MSHQEVGLTSIFIAIMTTSGSPSVTMSPGFTDTFSMTPGMGATAPLPPPPPVFCVTNFGVRSFSSLLPSCNIGNMVILTSTFYGAFTLPDTETGMYVLTNSFRTIWFSKAGSISVQNQYSRSHFWRRWGFVYIGTKPKATSLPDWFMSGYHVWYAELEPWPIRPFPMSRPLPSH